MASNCAAPIESDPTECRRGDGTAALDAALEPAADEDEGVPPPGVARFDGEATTTGRSGDEAAGALLPPAILGDEYLGIEEDLNWRS